MADRGPQWAAWVDALPATVRLLAERWRVRPDGGPTYGHCSLVLPVRTAEGAAAVLKVGFPDEESEHEHLALQRWGGDGAVNQSHPQWLKWLFPLYRCLVAKLTRPTWRVFCGLVG
jgi:hypothetical protein